MTHLLFSMKGNHIRDCIILKALFRPRYMADDVFWPDEAKIENLDLIRDCTAVNIA